jgi:predicted  nucleic acid-binding Zn ribbon protein
MYSANSIPEINALDSSHSRKPVTDALEKLNHLEFISLETKIIGKIFDLKGICTCTVRDNFILYWPFLSRGTPLRCGNCFLSVPLYQIPPTDNDCYQDILFWQAEYEACDTLNILSSVMEKAAIREISRFDSNLSKIGREVCQTIENLTGKPTYYYLYRYNGRSRNNELSRKCPECGGEWLLDKNWHNRFDFRCEKSKLVSNIAWDVR